jgi:peptide/nickel transport system ATP-binding protein
MAGEGGQTGAVLSAKGLEKRFAGRGRAPVVVLAGADVEIARGARVLLRGDSGSGKTTLARCLAGLEAPDAGEIWSGEGAQRSTPSDRGWPRRVQLVRQAAGESLNPRWTVVELLCEPGEIQGIGDAASRRREAMEWLKRVGLPEGAAKSRPGELSGGQRARVAVARALTLDPAMVILDESLTSLDLSEQARMLNLLVEAQGRRPVSYLFISHRPGMIRAIATVEMAMEAGRIRG